MAGILALDLGVTTGWAYANADALALWPTGGPLVERGLPRPEIKHGSITFTEKALRALRYDVPRQTWCDGARWWFYSHWLWSQLLALGPDHVVFEAPIPSARGSAVARGMAVQTESLCWQNKLRCNEAHNATVKRHFTGQGNARKPSPDQVKKGAEYRVMAVCRERGWSPANWDEADALAILDYAAHCMAPRGRRAA